MAVQPVSHFCCCCWSLMRLPLDSWLYLPQTNLDWQKEQIPLSLSLTLKWLTACDLWPPLTYLADWPLPRRGLLEVFGERWSTEGMKKAKTASTALDRRGKAYALQQVSIGLWRVPLTRHVVRGAQRRAPKKTEEEEEEKLLKEMVAKASLKLNWTGKSEEQRSRESEWVS